MKPTKQSFDYQPYLIRKVDSRKTRLMKVKEFLIRLSQIDERKFDYTRFIGSFSYETGVPCEGFNHAIREGIRTERPSRMQEQSTELAIYDCNYDDCGTCACIAGWTEIINRIPLPTLELDGYSTEFIAREVLMLNHDESAFLFFGKGRFGFKDLTMLTGEGTDPTIQDAIERLEYLINNSND
jgi:hypothetical protein